MRIEDEPLLERFRNRLFCEGCGVALRWPAEPHHIFGKGHGGAFRLDVEINLVALGGRFDCNCHRKYHDGGGEAGREKFLARVAERTGRTVESIRSEIEGLQNRAATPEEKWARRKAKRRAKAVPCVYCPRLVTSKARLRVGDGYSHVGCFKRARGR